MIRRWPEKHTEGGKSEICRHFVSERMRFRNRIIFSLTRCCHATSSKWRGILTSSAGQDHRHRLFHMIVVQSPTQGSLSWYGYHTRHPPFSTSSTHCIGSFDLSQKVAQATIFSFCHQFPDPLSNERFCKTRI